MNLRQPIIIYQYRISALFWRNKEVFLMAIESPRPPKPPIQPNAIRCTLYAVLNMQNKPNFRKSQMNANLYNTTDYERKRDWTLGENKPNSNPIKPNFRKAQMNIYSFITKGYRKKGDFLVQINKPNSNPIFLRTKTNATLFAAKDYENKTAFRPKKTNPKQTQFPKGQNELKIAYRRIWPHP